MEPGRIAFSRATSGAQETPLHINLGLRAESRLPQANIPGSSGAEAPLLIQRLNPLHCKQRGILKEEISAP